MSSEPGLTNHKRITPESAAPGQAKNSPGTWARGLKLRQTGELHCSACGRTFTLADASALEHEVRCFARLALRCQATRVGVKDPVCAWLLPRVAALAGLDNAGVFCTVAVTTFPRFFKHVSFATKKLLFALALIVQARARARAHIAGSCSAGYA